MAIRGPQGSSPVNTPQHQKCPWPCQYNVQACTNELRELAINTQIERKESQKNVVQMPRGNAGALYHLSSPKKWSVLRSTHDWTRALMMKSGEAVWGNRTEAAHGYGDSTVSLPCFAGCLPSRNQALSCSCLVVCSARRGCGLACCRQVENSDPIHSLPCTIQT